MKYDFDTPIDRRNTNSMKWDGDEWWRSDDLIPLGTSDMDFVCAQPIVDAIRKRAEHGVFGYARRPDSYFEAIVAWFKKRHDWKIEREWLCFSPSGVVQALDILINRLTRPGDKVLVQSPAYDPLSGVVTGNGRELVLTQLKQENGRYFIDFDDLAEKAGSGVKAAILCSPHNPTGRVWNRDELSRFNEICRKNRILVISDEIHFDVVYKGNKHIPFGSISEDAAFSSVLCTSASKSFNLGGLQLATVVIPDPAIRAVYNEYLKLAQIRVDNIFGAVALEAAYTKGEEWLDQMVAYVKGNLDFARSFFKSELPEVKINDPQGTYFAWLDFRQLGLPHAELRDLLLGKAKVELYDGLEFGQVGEGFQRLNMACPRSVLVEALNRIKRFCKEIIDGGGR